MYVPGNVCYSSKIGTNIVLGVLHTTDGYTEAAIACNIAITDTEWGKCHHLWSETSSFVIHSLARSLDDPENIQLYTIKTLSLACA